MNVSVYAEVPSYLNDLNKEEITGEIKGINDNPMVETFKKINPKKQAKKTTKKGKSAQKGVKRMARNKKVIKPVPVAATVSASKSTTIDETDDENEDEEEEEYDEEYDEEEDDEEYEENFEAVGDVPDKLKNCVNVLIVEMKKYTDARDAYNMRLRTMNRKRGGKKMKEKFRGMSRTGRSYSDKFSRCLDYVFDKMEGNQEIYNYVTSMVEASRKKGKEHFETEGGESYVMAKVKEAGISMGELMDALNEKMGFVEQFFVESKQDVIESKLQNVGLTVDDIKKEFETKMQEAPNMNERATYLNGLSNNDLAVFSSIDANDLLKQRLKDNIDVITKICDLCGSHKKELLENGNIVAEKCDTCAKEGFRNVRGYDEDLEEEEEYTADEYCEDGFCDEEPFAVTQCRGCSITKDLMINNRENFELSDDVANFFTKAGDVLDTVSEDVANTIIDYIPKKEEFKAKKQKKKAAAPPATETAPAKQNKKKDAGSKKKDFPIVPVIFLVSLLLCFLVFALYTYLTKEKQAT